MQLNNENAESMKKAHSMSLNHDENTWDMMTMLNNKESNADRKEEDKLELLAGLENEVTLGYPITIIVFNKDMRKQDYKFSDPLDSHKCVQKFKSLKL